MPDNEKKHDDGTGELLERVSAQLRLSLGNIYSALERLAPAETRDGDSRTDMNAAVLCQSYYRILRLTNNLAEAGRLREPAGANGKLRNDDIVGRRSCWAWSWTSSAARAATSFSWTRIASSCCC